MGDGQQRLVDARPPRREGGQDGVGLNFGKEPLRRFKQRCRVLTVVYIISAFGEGKGCGRLAFFTQHVERRSAGRHGCIEPYILPERP
jgi:hypothetical protein